MARARRGEPVDGVLLLDKPSGITSNLALQKARRLLAAAKAGHTGTLDPLASGLLPLTFGEATKFSSDLLDAAKTYEAELALGVATSTGDAEGEVTATADVAVSAIEVEATLRQLSGAIEQVPPMFSALKRDGVPLYRLARSGVEIERQPRRVVIEELTLDTFEWPAVTLTVRCSKGTYVRTLVEDLAKAAGTVGHVAALRRLAVEPFTEQGMHPLAALEAAAAEGVETLHGLLLAPDEALPGWPAARLAEADAIRLTQGQTVAAGPDRPPGRIKVYDAAGRFIAIGEVAADGGLRPERVFYR